MGWRSQLIDAGFGFLGATRLHRLAAPVTRGLGAILTFHNVRPDSGDAFAPNKVLEVTPAFLERIILRLRELGYTIVTIDEAVPIIAGAAEHPGPIAVLTFDDGFRNHLEWALPVLERHRAPAVFYVPTGFLDRTARLWWVELEEAIRKADRVRVSIAGEAIDLPAVTPAQKTAAFAAIYWRLRRGSEEQLLAVIGALCADHGIDEAALVESLCLDWTQVAQLAQSPLVTIGAHTVAHLMLAKHDEARVRGELAGGKAALEKRLGQPVRHFAYPVGDPTSATARDFRLAGEAHYTTAVTTRPGVLFPAHRDRLLCLPRVSVNGKHQSVGEFDILLSGVPFTLWNRGRRVAPI